MAQYGELLDIIEPEKEKMYKAFDDYFNHPIMFKIKNINNCSMYMSKIACLLSNECRYIICFIPEDSLIIGSKEHLSNLRWISFQSRTLSDKHDLPSHSYQPIKEGQLNAIITRTSMSAESSTYKCDAFPLIITLLNKKSESDYQPRGTIIAALETYSTIITL
jgi:hypothetical protein